jgi:pimeloyl-ACP methyl ester carboxylesterase
MNLFQLIRSSFGLGGRLFPRQASHIARRLLMTPRLHPPKDWEVEAEAAATRVHFGPGLSALRWGTQGPIALCVHGWEGRASQFAGYLSPLLAAGYQVIALDAPAHGQSSGKQAHPLSFADAILDAGWEFGPVELVIGHSMGAGALAIAMARGLDARRAVLIAGPSSLRNMLLRFAHFINLPPLARDYFLSLVEDYTQAPLDSVEIHQLARNFTVPALVVHDREDRMMPYAEAQQVVSNWPDAELFSTSGLGHHRVLTDPKVIAAVTQFARSVAAP